MTGSSYTILRYQVKYPDESRKQFVPMFSFPPFNLGRSFSVQHCSPMIPRPRVGCTNSQALPWLELATRSLSSTTPAPQITCNGAHSDGNKHFGSIGNWTRDPLHQSPIPEPLCHTAPLLSIAQLMIMLLHDFLSRLMQRRCLLVESQQTWQMRISTHISSSMVRWQMYTFLNLAGALPLLHSQMQRQHKN